MPVACFPAVGESPGAKPRNDNKKWIPFGILSFYMGIRWGMEIPSCLPLRREVAFARNEQMTEGEI